MMRSTVSVDVNQQPLLNHLRLGRRTFLGNLRISWITHAAGWTSAQPRTRPVVHQTAHISEASATSTATMAPQTALAAQLQQKLGAGAAAGSSINAFVANLKATGKHRASFLFSSKEASDMDPEAIFAMGSNAVLELARVDRRFAQYSDTLFGEAFQSYDRSLKVISAVSSVLV